MTYREQITPWIVVRLLPSMRRVTLARFRKRSDADSYAQTLRQLIPEIQLVVMFDPSEVESKLLARDFQNTGQIKVDLE
jgi:hypothetical protein